MFLSVLEAKWRPGRYFLDLISLEKCITPLREVITFGLDLLAGLVRSPEVKKCVFEHFRLNGGQDATF